MADTIKIKRGNSSGLGTLTLQAGEPALVLDTEKLYIGNGTGGKILINKDKAELGLGNVDNTSDLNKPVSTAQQQAINQAINNLKDGVSSDGDTLKKLRGLISGIQTLLNSNDVNLDSLQEIVNYIKTNKNLIDGITTNKVDKTTTINGQALSGNITITKGDIGLSNVANESKATMFNNPTFTGAVNAPKPATGDNSTLVATTSWVKEQGYITSASLGNIDGGTF